MPKTITALNSLLETRRLLRSIKLTTERHKKELSKIDPTAYSTKRAPSKHNNNIRVVTEKIYRDSKQNIKLLSYISITLKTHLHDTTNLNRKMYQQSINLLEQNQQLEKIAENIMEAFITSTQPDTPLNTIMKDLVKKFSKNLTVSSKIISKGEKPCGVISLRSVQATVTIHCVLFSDENGNRYKTFMNEVPVDISDKNFNTFLSPSQAYKEIMDVLAQDGIIR